MIKLFGFWLGLLARPFDEYAVAEDRSARARATMRGAYTARRRSWADSMSLNAITRPVRAGNLVHVMRLGGFVDQATGMSLSPDAVLVEVDQQPQPLTMRFRYHLSRVASMARSAQISFGRHG